MRDYRETPRQATKRWDAEGSLHDHDTPVCIEEREVSFIERKRRGHLQNILLLFITAGMVVERKPCVRGEKE